MMEASFLLEPSYCSTDTAVDLVLLCLMFGLNGRFQAGLVRKAR